MPEITFIYAVTLLELRRNPCLGAAQAVRARRDGPPLHSLKTGRAELQLLFRFRLIRSFTKAPCHLSTAAQFFAVEYFTRFPLRHLAHKLALSYG